MFDMKKLQQMQQEMQNQISQTQKELADQTVEAAAGGEAEAVVVLGDGDVLFQTQAIGHQGAESLVDQAAGHRINKQVFALAGQGVLDQQDPVVGQLRPAALNREDRGDRLHFRRGFSLAAEPGGHRVG